MRARLLAGRCARTLKGMRGPALPVPFLLALVMSAMVLAGLWGVPRGFAALSAVGPAVPLATTPPVTFPTWYKDSRGIALQFCLDGTAACLASTAADLDPANPAAAGEAFWWVGDVIGMPVGTGRANLVLAMEAAFGSADGRPQAGSEMTFGRIRVRAFGLASGDYVVTHPYGVLTFTVTAGPGAVINFTQDLGCVPVPGLPVDCDFGLALNDLVDGTRTIGPFLVWDTFPNDPLLTTPNGRYVGDGVTPHAVVGSPTGNNFFRVEGPSGVGQSNLFTIMGKLAVSAANDTVTVPANASNVPINVLGNDGTGLVVSAVTQPANGASAVAGGGGWLTYSNNGTAGADTFTYDAQDPTGITGTARVNITAHAGNAAPVARNDAFTVTVSSLNNVLNVLSATIGLADSDADGDLIFVSAATQPVPARGTTTVGAAGRNVVFDAGGATGPSTFTYTLSDGLATSQGTVTVTVNTAPVAVNDAFTVTANTTNNPLDVLLNDIDPERTAGQQVLTVSAVGTPSNGTVTIPAGGANVLFSPPSGFGGTSVFTYTVTDGAASATGTATITVNRFPVAAADNIPVPINSSGNALNVLGNDSDPDGNPIRVTSIGTPAKGTASIGTGGANIIYTPNAGIFGTDAFTYTISDGPAAGAGVLTASTTVTATIDRAPVAVGDSARAPQSSTNNAVNVLANDTDPDGDTLVATAVTQPANGTAAVGAGGANVTYTPSAGFVGVDTFTYTMRGALLTSTATVTMSVHRGPVAANDTFKVGQNTTGNVLNVLLNDRDPDGDPIFVSAVTQATNGIVSIGTGGANVTYSPNLGFLGADSFTYTVSDGQLTDTATVSVLVSRSPLALDDVATVLRNSIANPVNVLANDFDPDGDPLTVAAVGQGGHGAAAIGVAAVNVLYTPSVDFTGADVFTYTVSDGQLTSTARVNVIVREGKLWLPLLVQRVGGGW